MPPAKKKQRTTGATILGLSDFPAPATAPAPAETPLDLFLADNDEGPSAGPLTSTPISSAASKPQFESPTQATEPIVHEFASTTEVQKIVQAALDSHKCACNSGEHIQMLEQRLAFCEGELKLSQQKITELTDKLSQQEARGPGLKVRPDMSNMTLTPLDAVKLHEHDSLVASVTLEPDVLSRMRTFSKSRRIFISNLARKMFSVEERVRDCNVSGAKNRPPMSPTKSRFERICYYTAEQFGVEMNAQLQADVRKIIDETNRKYRDELKIRKYRKGSVEGTILQHNDDNELD